MPLSSTPTTTLTGITIESQPVAFISKGNLAPLAVGLLLGLLAIVAVVLCGLCYLYFRRRRSPNDLDEHNASPYTVPPLAQTNPWDRKRPPQTSPQPGVPILTSPLGLAELGPPPSY